MLPECLCPASLGATEKPPPELAREHYSKQREGEKMNYDQLVSEGEGGMERERGEVEGGRCVPSGINSPRTAVCVEVKVQVID